MTKVYCIVGLPGSGKTFLANKMASALTKVCILDDIKNIFDLPENDVFHTIIVIDPYFCLTNVRKMADIFLTKKYSSNFIPVVDWLFFENNMEKCLKNIKYRDDGRKVEGLIKLLNIEYTIPDGIVPKEIWQQDEKPMTISIQYPASLAQEMSEDDKRQGAWAKQRISRGFDNTELWNLDIAFAKLMLPRVKEFVEYAPPYFEQKSWRRDMTLIINGLELIASGECVFNQKQEKTIRLGLKSFIRNIRSMWV